MGIIHALIYFNCHNGDVSNEFYYSVHDAHDTSVEIYKTINIYLTFYAIVGRCRIDKKSKKHEVAFRKAC